MKINAARVLTGAMVMVAPTIFPTPADTLLPPTFSRVLSFLQDDHWTRQRQSHPKQRQTLQARLSNLRIE